MEKTKVPDNKQNKTQQSAASQSGMKQSAGKSSQQSISTLWHGVPEVHYQYF